MNLIKMFRGTLAVLFFALLAACSGEVHKTPQQKSTTQIGVETTSTGKKRLAKLEGSELVVTNAVDDQQNPFLLYLPDKNLYFSVWEDWRNKNVSGSDIYGQFVNSDGTLCGEAFAITNASGNQTAPTAAYSLAKGKIVVAWQDTRVNDINANGKVDEGEGGYVYFAPITTFPTAGTCGEFVPPVATSGTPVGFSSILEENPTITSTPSSKQTLLIGNGDGVKTVFSQVLIAPVIGANATPAPSTILNVVAGAQKLNDSGNGGLSGSGSGTINYNSGQLTVTFNSPPAANEQVVVEYQYNIFSVSQGTRSLNDKLLSRKSPKIIYDSARSRFWIVWTESRSVISRISETCFGFAKINWETGDTNSSGYVMLDETTLAEIPNGLINGAGNPVGADILRDVETRTNRRMSFLPEALKETYTYEFFTAANNVTAAADTTSPETLLAWEGNRQKLEVVCTCEDVNSNKVCDVFEPVKAAATISNFDDGLVHIYGIFDKNIQRQTIFSTRFDTSNSSTANYPTLAFDPISRRFYSAWEDLRDGTNTKIYGQLILTGGGLYNQNRIVSFQDTDLDGKQDSNIANSRQTKPFASYDPTLQRYFVAWQDGRNGDVSSENLDIYGQYIDTEGTRRGSNYAISTAPGSQLAPVVAYNSADLSLDTNGKQFLAVWKDARTNQANPSENTNASDVHGQRFSLGSPQMTLLKTDNTPVSPLQIDFGKVTANQLQRIDFKVKNTGDADLAIDCISPTPNSPFSFDNPPTDLAACGDGKSIVLIPDTEILLTVKFAPTSGGAFKDKFTLKSNSGNTTVNLQGLGIPPNMDISESDGTNDLTLNYGIVQTGQSKDLTLTITNNSTVSYNIASISDPGGAFSFVNKPSGSVALATGSSLTLTIKYSPTTATNDTGQFVISTDKSLSSVISLAGSGAPSGSTPPPTDTGTPTTGTNNPAPSSGGKSGCFIATAAYGSYLDPHVMVLRHFRDNVLLKSKAGTAFVEFYYRYSPPIADFIREHEILRTVTRWLLTPLIFAVKYSFAASLCLFLTVFGGVYAARRLRMKRY